MHELKNLAVRSGDQMLKGNLDQIKSWLAENKTEYSQPSDPLGRELNFNLYGINFWVCISVNEMYGTRLHIVSPNAGSFMLYWSELDNNYHTTLNNHLPTEIKPAFVLGEFNKKMFEDMTNYLLMWEHRFGNTKEVLAE